MYMIAEVSQYVAVASFAEAWIQIVRAVNSRNYMEVASFAEAWIEMQDNINNTTESVRRLLRGGVD